jgi:hypothetical protein
VEPIVRISAIRLAILALCLALVGSDGTAAQTLKERLSDKGSDEQRVDNCGVPPERHGTKPRPGCQALPRAPGTATPSRPK